MRKVLYTTLLVVLVCGSLSAQSADEVLAVGSHAQPFADASLIDTKTRVQLRLNPPRKTHERNVVPEHEWEEMGVSYSTILKDGDQYKMWYQCSAAGNREAGEAGMLTNVCYATSTDGIDWTKPTLGLIEFRGGKENNIVIENFMGTVFFDPHKSGGDRFKMIGKRKPEKGLELRTSADGLNWKPMKTILSKGYFDTQNLAFWDDRLQKYVAYVRRWAPQPETGPVRTKPLCCRRVGRTATEDLEAWPEPEIVFSLDDKDPIEADIYTPSVIPYPRTPGLYMMFPSMYFHYDMARYKRHNLGTLDVQFGVSRDGFHWSRPQRTPYVALGRSGEFDSGGIYMSVAMLVEGAEIWMYYVGYDFLHGGPVEELQWRGVISRLVQRVDGFVSADSDYAGGELTTKPIVFTGNKLTLNLDTHALGTARVEMLDQAGNVIPGFGAKQCDLINGNAVDHTVTWNGNDDVSAWSGTPVRLRFVMRNTKLFAFRFVP